MQRIMSTTIPAWVRTRLGFGLFWIVQMAAGWTALRLLLVLAFGPERQDIRETLLVLMEGGQRDLYVALVIGIPLMLYMTVLPEKTWAHPWHRRLFWTVGASGTFVFLFLLVVEYFFFEEFKSRFNTVAVDYLLYPHEVFVNIWDSYPTGKVLLVCLAATAFWWWAVARWFAPMWHIPVPRRLRLTSTIVCLTAALSCALGIGLSAPHVSADRTINELANDGTLSFVRSFWTRQLDYPSFYRTLSKDEAYGRARRLLATPKARFVETGPSIRRSIVGDSTRPRLNVVLVLVESFGSSFWGCLGRTNSLTPNMDRLAATEGLLFSNIYASGNRTVRGMEGVLSSFPPLPGDSIVKRHLTDNVETLARVLHRDGYSTRFLYGGRGVFDSMRSYALRNGYDRFIEQSDFANPTFSTVWGVCDEDLFDRGLQECRELSKSKRPFFATMLTVSNHRPYTFPEGRIPDPQRKRRSVVKYTDYALGRFFDQAKHEEFWTNTVFVVVADHGARVYGQQTIPIHSYEIPFLVLGPAVVKAPARIETLGCSLDVAPTLLGLVGRPYESMFFGRDLLNDPKEVGRALVNHNRDVGMLSRDRLVVLGLKKNLEFYQGRPKQAEFKELTRDPSPADWEAARDCMALYQVADDLYMHQGYALDTSEPNRPGLTASAAH